MKKLILFGVILLGITSCVTRKACERKFPPVVKDSVSIVEVVKDTTIYISDSAGLTALLECDSLGKIRVKQIQDYYAGQFVKPTVVIRDNWLKVGCKIDSAAVYWSWKETHIREVKTRVYVQITNQLTGLQTFFCWSGGILWCVVLLFILLKILVKVLPAGRAVSVLSKFI